MLKGKEMAEIRLALLDLQAHRCAYCERRTGDHREYDGHIEHFLDQAGHELLDLHWSNLFWSCNDERTCGKHKDKCRNWHGDQRKFAVDDLIQPGHDDPEGYLLFVSDGTVRPRAGIDASGLRRAEETIRVFQLNESARLVKDRHDVIRHFFTAVVHLLEHAPQSLAAYVKSMLTQHARSPHSTAIKHFLTSVAP